jgi:hypothetical protein
VLVVLATIIVVGFLAGFFRDPDRAMHEVEAELASGQRGVLIGDTGMPRSWRWVLGEKLGRVTTSSDGSFTLHSWGHSLVEFVQDPQWNRFRFRAEVRHCSCAEPGHPGGVGLFVGCRTIPTSVGPLHHYCQLAFNDIVDEVKQLKERDFSKAIRMPPFPKGNRVGLLPYLQGDRPSGDPWDMRMGGPNPELFKPAGSGGGPWRSLVIEVSPEAVRAFWEGLPVGELSSVEIAKYATETIREVRQRDPTIQGLETLDLSLLPRGAVGVSAERGSVSFRAVLIEPLGN